MLRYEYQAKYAAVRFAFQHYKESKQCDECKKELISNLQKILGL